VALRLRKLATRAGRLLDRAASESGKKQTRAYPGARGALDNLLSIAKTANGRSTLGVPLAPIETAADALLGLLPQ